MAIQLPQFLRTILTAFGFTRNVYASTRLNTGSQKKLALPKTDAGWQGQAWQYYEVIPEVRQVVENRSRAVSKVVLRVARLDENGKKEIVDDERTKAFLDWLWGGRAKHSGHLALMSQQETVVGESIIVIIEEPDPNGGDPQFTWWTLAPDQVDTARMTGPAGYVEIKSPIDGQQTRYPTPDGQGDTIRLIRAWNPHPHQQWEANSPIRGGISTLDTMAHLNASIKSAALSRLIGGGLYPIPIEAQLPQPTESDPDGMTSTDKFRQDLYDAASTAIQNPASPAAQMPIFLHIPAEAIKAMLEKPIDFSTKFDERAAELLQMEIHRFAQGQPMPTEKMAGEGAANHWGQWQYAEEDLQMDIAPHTERLLAPLTEHVLQPLLGDELFLDPDYTQLVTRPDRTPEAMELYIAGIITLEEAREMSGFPEEFDGHLKETIRVPSERVETDTGADNVTAEIEKPAGNRPEIPQRPPGREGATEYAALVADTLLVDELLRETGRKMLTSAPRCDRGPMMEVPEQERHMRFDRAFAAFQMVIPKVTDRYSTVLTPDQIHAAVLAAQNAITAERVHD